jgi:hypothetical protein
MRDLSLDERICEERVCGITVDDIRQEVIALLKNNEYTSEFLQYAMDFESSTVNALLDNMSFSAMCALRRAQGLDVPLL